MCGRCTVFITRENDQNPQMKSPLFPIVMSEATAIVQRNPFLSLHASKRKIKDIESSSEEEYELKEAKRAEGYRFVDMGSLGDLVQRVHAFSENCSG